MGKVIKIENLSKAYQLGEIGTGTLSRDLERSWAKIRGKEDPFLKIGEVNDRTVKGKSDVAWALRDINFDVEQGEAIGIIGRNGAGKSTLLKILSRVTAPSTGSVKVKGRIASLLEVGTGFHPELSGKENIYLNGAILGMRKAEIRRKFDEIVDFSGVERYIDTPVKRYSSGMYVRLAFAVAAHLESEILIVDEVLAVGDAEFQKKCLGKMGDVSTKEGRTVLFVSHNMASIQSLSTRSMLLSNGEIVVTGDTRDVIDEYLNVVAEQAKFLLTERVDRQGNGLLKIENVFYRNESGKKVDSFYSGQNSYICLKYTAREKILGTVLVALGFNDNRGVRIFNVNNESSGNELIIDESGLIICEIPALPLAKGVYLVTLFVSVNSEITDWVQDAFVVNVEDSDFFGTGKVMFKSQGSFLVKNSWYVDNQS